MRVTLELNDIQRSDRNSTYPTYVEVAILVNDNFVQRHMGSSDEVIDMVKHAVGNALDAEIKIFIATTEESVRYKSLEKEGDSNNTIITHLNPKGYRRF